MTERSWTPGPWFTYDNPRVNTIYISNIACDVGRYSHCEIGYDTNPRDVDKANAHLIAAAPDLYDALDEIDKWSRRKNIALPSMRIYKALAKARGETNV